MAGTSTSAYLLGAGDVRFLEQPVRELGANDVRVAIVYTGICGTDLHLYQGMQFYSTPHGPRPLGHEASGRITEIGAGVGDFHVGDRVALIPGAPCRTCALCRNGRPSVCSARLGPRSGMWSRSVIAPAAIVYHLPDGISDQVGALAEPLACAVRAIDRTGLRSGDRVCILGGGPIGLMLLALARASGASATVVSEPRPFRRALAQQLGADHAVDPVTGDVAAVVSELSGGLGADVVFEAVGSPHTVEQALTLVAAGGSVMLVGVADPKERVSFSPAEMFAREITIRGSKESVDTGQRVFNWLGRLDLQPLITHTLPLAAVEKGLRVAAQGDSGKVLLKP
ncbi:MAG: zinc-binding dehydrogenase [Chloroflexota bacterium]|nr:zinc-binding dehydrogenase [Chloroflexota bacterium]